MRVVAMSTVVRSITLPIGPRNRHLQRPCQFAIGDSIVFKLNSTIRMVRINRYDNLNRRTKSEALGTQLSILRSFAYAYNDANQRVVVTNLDNSCGSRCYHSLGQVTSGKKLTRALLDRLTHRAPSRKPTGRATDVRSPRSGTNGSKANEHWTVGASRGLVTPHSCCFYVGASVQELTSRPKSQLLRHGRRLKFREPPAALFDRRLQ